MMITGLFRRLDADVQVAASADLEKSRLFTLGVKRVRLTDNHTYLADVPTNSTADAPWPPLLARAGGKDLKLSAWPSPLAVRGPPCRPPYCPTGRLSG